MANAETAYAVMIPGFLALAGLGLTRKRAYGRLRLAGLFALMLAGGLGLGACSQRYNYYHKPPAGNPGTPTGTYTLVVTGITGTGSTLSTGSVQFTFTVKAS
jgi:cytochrome c-type biogenesis protein CcmE